MKNKNRFYEILTFEAERGQQPTQFPTTSRFEIPLLTNGNHDINNAILIKSLKN